MRDKQLVFLPQRPKLRSEGSRRNRLDVFISGTSGSALSFQGARLLPSLLHLGRQRVPENSAIRPRSPGQPTRLLGPRETEGHKAPGGSQRQVAGTRACTENKVSRDSFGVCQEHCLRTWGCGQIVLSASMKGGCRGTGTEQSRLRTGQQEKAPSRRERSGSQQADPHDSGTRPRTERAEAIRAVSLAKEQTETCTRADKGEVASRSPGAPPAGFRCPVPSTGRLPVKPGTSLRAAPTNPEARFPSSQVGRTEQAESANVSLYPGG